MLYYKNTIIILLILLGTLLVCLGIVKTASDHLSETIETTATTTDSKAPTSDTESSVTEDLRIPVNADPIPNPPTILNEALSQASASTLFVYDATTDTFLANKNNDEQVIPASVTKLLTALYALEVMPREALIQPGNEILLISKESSIAYVRPFHTLTLEMLVQGMMLPSGNDAAYAVAAGVARYLTDNPNLDPQEAVNFFMEGLNDYAKAIGCTGTHFTVPDGLAGEEHYTSVHDLLIIGKAVLQNPIIMKYTRMVSERVTYASGHTITWNNGNRLIRPDDAYYSPYVIGLKTGSLDDNYSIYSAAEIDGHTYLIGVFGSPTMNGRYDDAHLVLNALLSLSIDE